MNKEELWEDKYVKEIVSENEEDYMYIDELPPVILYKDEWGAVLYAVNNLGEIQRYYENEEEYLRATPYLIFR